MKLNIVLVATDVSIMTSVQATTISMSVKPLFFIRRAYSTRNSVLGARLVHYANTPAKKDRSSDPGVSFVCLARLVVPASYDVALRKLGVESRNPISRRRPEGESWNTLTINIV
jgi:hypothetical protein